MSAYDEIAEWYAKKVQTPAFAGKVATQSLLKLVGEVAGQHVCDLACGEGRLSRELTRRGASVVGVDLSIRLIELARQFEARDQAGIIYQVDNAQELASLATSSFDGVICNLALMDIPDLNKTFSAVWRILQPGGWFCFSITHPCFQAPHSSWVQARDGQLSRQIIGYFKEEFWQSTNPDGIRGKVGAYHRTLSTYLNSLVETGFRLEKIEEPFAPDDVLRKEPGYEVTPGNLVIRCQKI